MEQIYPLTEPHIHEYAGMNVCAVLKTGFRQFGILERCSGGVLYLKSGFHPAANNSNTLADQHQSSGSPESSELTSLQQPDSPSKKRSAKPGQSGRAKAASTTNYEKKKHIPSSKISAVSDKNVAKIELNDIAFLLLLV